MKNTFIKVLAGLSLISVTAVGAGSAGAVTNSILLNGSFEYGSYPVPAPSWTDLTASNPCSGICIDNWTVTSGSVDWVGSYWTAEDGNYSIDLNGTSQGSISQTLTTVPGATYDVNFHLSGNFDNILYANDSWVVGHTGANQMTKTTTVSASGDMAYPYTATYNSSWSHSNMEWAPELYQFTATSNSTTLMFTGDPTAGGWGPVIDNVSVTRIGLGGGNSPSYDPATNVVDTYNNFAVVDTNRPITSAGDLTSWSYYAAQTNGSVALIVTSPVTSVGSGANVLYVSPLSTPSSTGLNTVSLPTLVPVAPGDNVGLYFQGTPVVVDYTYTTNPAVNAGCTQSCVYYTSNGVYPSEPSLGSMGLQGATSRIYSFSVDGITAPDAPAVALVAANGPQQLTVAWTGPSWWGGTDPGTYDVYIGTSAGGEDYGNPVCTTSSTSCTINGLADATTYYVTVEAVNVAGNSLRSNEVSAMTWYNFSGFYSPIKFSGSSSDLNMAKAGSAVPVQFSLGGNAGLDIFVAGTPTVAISGTCTAQASTVSTATAGGSTLSFDSTTDSYTYPWKTSKSWAGCTGELTVQFVTSLTMQSYIETAYFSFH